MVGIIKKAQLIEDISLRVITILILVVILEFIFNIWINLEYYSRFMNKLDKLK